jgi:hypothetical protein
MTNKWENLNPKHKGIWWHRMISAKIYMKGKSRYTQNAIQPTVRREFIKKFIKIGKKNMNEHKQKHVQR